MAAAITEYLRRWFLAPGGTGSNHADEHTQPVPRALLWVLFALILIAAWLRLSNLGQLGLDRDNDEDIMAVAVLGILEHGYPLMPSGMIYLRSAPLLYLMAGATEIFGVNEFALRVVPALFGVLLVPLVFVVARRCFGAKVALLAAALTALSLWQVEVTRLARMYAPFAFTYLLALYAIFRGFIDGHRGWRIASLPLAALTIPIHTLGFTLCAAFGIVVLAPGLAVSRRALAALGVSTTAVTFVLWDDFETRMFDRALTLAESSSGGAASAAGSDQSQSFLAQVVERLYLPPALPIETAVGVMVGVVALASAAALFIWLRRQWPTDRSWLPAALLAATLGAASAHQMTLAAILFVALVFARPTGRSTWIGYLAAWLGVVGAAWLASGLLGAADGAASTRDVLRALGDYPRVEVLRPFFADRLVLTLLAGLGAYLSTRVAVERRQLTAAAFFLAVGGGALVVHGIFESQFRPRYNFNLDALLLMFAAAGIVSSGYWLASRLSRSTLAAPASPSNTGLFVTGLLVVVALMDLRSAAAFAYPGYWEGMPAARAAQLDFPPAVDRRSPARYVAEHRGPADEVMSMDWFTTYFYTRRVDYLLRSGKFDWGLYDKDGLQHDAYLGSVIVSGPEVLRHRVGDPCQPTLWLITSARAMTAREKTSAEIVSYLTGLAPQKVYDGMDGVSSVYRLPPQGDCPTR